MSASGINKVILVGNLGQDPDVRYMPNGNAVANISVATSESWKNKDTGAPQEKTEWHRVVFFGKLAEIVEKYLKKGSKVYLEGKLQTRKWEKDGQTRYTTEVVVDQRGTMQMLGDRGGNGQARDHGTAGGQARHAQEAPNAAQEAAKRASALAEGEFDDDVPF